MSKKTLPFSGRLSFRSNGLIDITSGDDFLAGFRVTLKKGTDSHAVAEEALAAAGIAKSAPKEFYAADLYKEDLPGVLIGLTEDGEPLHVEAPAPGSFIWIIGTSPYCSIFSLTLLGRLMEARRTTFSAYDRATPVIEQCPVELTGRLNFEDADSLVEEWLVNLKESRLLRFVAFEDASTELQRALNRRRDILVGLGIVPILVAHEGEPRLGELAFFFQGKSVGHWKAGVPTPDEWDKHVPLGRSYVKQVNSVEATSFRVL